MNIRILDLYSTRNDIERIFRCQEYYFSGLRVRALVYKLDWARILQSVTSFLLVGRTLHQRCQHLLPLCGGVPLSKHLLALWLISVPLHLVSVTVRDGVHRAWFPLEYSVFVCLGEYSFEPLIGQSVDL